MNAEHLENASCFKLSGAIILAEGSCSVPVQSEQGLEWLRRHDMAKTYIKSNNSSFPKQLIKLSKTKSIVLGVLTCGYESWTLRADTERSIQAVESKCLKSES